MNKLFNITKQNTMTIGNKKLAYIDESLLTYSDAYQRETERVHKLVRNFDMNKMDALKVSIHEDEEKYYIVDGLHRFEAAKQKGITSLVCEVLDFGSDKHERELKEAKIFATQDEEVVKLTPLQKHKSRILLGYRGNINLQELVDKYNIELKPSKARHMKKENCLTGFAHALKVAEKDKESLDYTFRLIKESGWCFSQVGYGNISIDSLSSMFRLHPNQKDLVFETLLKYCKPNDPSKLSAEAMYKYPERKLVEARVMILEDFFIKKTKTKRVYYGGRVNDTIKAFSVA